MHYLKLSSNASSVKMYPRLAMPGVPHKPKRSLRQRRARSVPAGAPEERETAREQVRTKLLHMILENERVRRNQLRPNAS